MKINVTAMRLAMADRGYGGGELARVAGVRPLTISNVLSGRRIPRPKTLKKIADALNVRPSTLLIIDD